MLKKIRFLVMLAFLTLPSPAIQAHSANMVWFEFRDDGRFRVYVQYTIPELKEFREAYIDFKSQKKAEAFYWHLVRGGDFHLGSPKAQHFHTPSLKPQPW